MMPKMQTSTVMERAIEWQRTTKKPREPRLGILPILIERKADRFFRLGHHPDRDIKDHAECAHRPAHQAECIEARHILEDRAAEPQCLATAIEDARAQYMVANRPRKGP